MSTLHPLTRETSAGAVCSPGRQCQHARPLVCWRPQLPVSCPAQPRTHRRHNVTAHALVPAGTAATTPQTAQQAAQELKTLLPAASPSASGYLNVSPVHTVAWYEYGNPYGPAAVFLHGGPGAATWPNHSRFFDLSYWRVILLDQRGCGNSTPRGCLADNTTEALVGDLEQLRTHLLIESWLVVGGSWGVTLALAYASAHPARVCGLVLRGVCLMRDKEVDWLFGGPAGMLRPAAWSRFIQHLPQEDRHQPLVGYYKLLLSSEPAVQAAAAQSWMAWESAVGVVPPPAEPMLKLWSGGLQGSWVATPHPQQPSASSPRTPPTPLPTPSNTTTSQIAPGVQGSALKRPRTSKVPSSLMKRASQFQGGPSMSYSAVQALLVCHYCVHQAFELASEPLLSPERMAALRTIPCIAVQGESDLICPPGTAWELHESWPEMELRLVPGAGHSMYDPRITHELVEAVAAFTQLAAAAQPPRN